MGGPNLQVQMIRTMVQFYEQGLEFDSARARILGSMIEVHPQVFVEVCSQQNFDDAILAQAFYALYTHLSKEAKPGKYSEIIGKFIATNFEPHFERMCPILVTQLQWYLERRKS